MVGEQKHKPFEILTAESGVRHFAQVIMLAASDPNLIVGGLAVGGLALYAFWGLIVWVRNAPVKPDPWDAQIEQEIQDAPENCPRCSTPQPPTAWFCEHCGRAVGPYNNLMPYVQIFSEGEVLRNGTQDRVRKSPLVVLGYFLITFNFYLTAAISFRHAFIVSLLMIFCLVVFWRAVFRNLHRPDAESKDDQSNNLSAPK